MRTGVQGGKPPSEFLEGVPRKSSRRPERSTAAEPAPSSHIDLRVVRMVNAKFTCHRDDWRNFLDELGTDNHSLGTARALGAISMTYIPAKHLNSMVADKYPRDFHNAKRKLTLYRKINSGLGSFIRTECQVAFNMQTDVVAKDYHERREDQRRDEINDIFRELGMKEDAPLEQEVVLTAEDQARLEFHSYGAANLAVRDLDFYGKNRYGLDLSHNQIAYEERYGLTGFLKHEFGLDTRILDADWVPHATALQLHDHVEVPDSLQVNGYMPKELAFLPPKTESLGL